MERDKPVKAYAFMVKLRDSYQMDATFYSKNPAKIKYYAYIVVLSLMITIFSAWVTLSDRS